MLDAALGAVFSQLSQLTQLVLDVDSTSSLAVVSCLTQLQKLDLTRPTGSRQPFELQLLPSSLTELQFSRAVSSSKGCRDGWQLPSLRVFTAYQESVHPAALLRMPQLQQLRLDGQGFISMEDMLTALSQLQQMVYMALRDFRGVAPAACYAALTASPYLKGFELTSCRMAAAAAQHMFPPGRLCPQLQRMRIAEYDRWPVEGRASDRWADDQAGGYLGLVIGPPDAAELVSCCPQLQELGPVMVGPGTTFEDLQPLVQLSALTRLQIGGAACDNVSMC
jgi:hypothetical protein